MSDVLRMFNRVIADCQLLWKFTQAHMITRGVWDAQPADVRKRLMDHGYVTVHPMRVILTQVGLEVIGYRGATA